MKKTITSHEQLIEKLTTTEPVIQPNKKLKAGRPVKQLTLEEVEGVLYATVAQGNSVETACKMLNISTSKFYKLTKESEAIGEMYEIAKAHSTSVHDKILLMASTGKIKNYNFKPHELFLKGNHREKYGDKREIKVDYQPVIIDSDDVNVC